MALEMRKGQRRSNGLLRADAAKTRLRALETAMREFAEHGLAGARVDKIARKAGVNKQALYYYFGNKEQLYEATLENGYDRVHRQNAPEDLSAMPPAAAMRRLVEIFFDRVNELRDVVRLVADENRYKGRHIRSSSRIRQINEPLITQVRDTLARGEDQGVFRRGVDADQLWLSIVSISQFYVSNIYTLSHILGKDLDEKRALAKRRAHVADLIVSALRP